ncbi:MAG TPA: 23S rRNA (adenine(2503)-C(2))-methyltransferase RlmN [Terriglobia bacterium]|nr:23S rRNA (adenine(2503)-C(2))-methyltransferase RlmN [Terriglobia bacterium]
MKSAIPAPQENLLGLDKLDLCQLAELLDEPKFRGTQLFRDIYARRQRDFAQCTELPGPFRQILSSRYRVDYPEIKGRMASRDGSVRYLLSLHDGESVETVYMPDEGRVTLCVSSQVGCAVNCRFCFTALMGVKRNLDPGEIIGQIIAVTCAEQHPAGTPLNVVFMGMGEPLLNLDSVMKAVRIMVDPDGLAIALRRITISTAGVVPKIHLLAREAVRPKLAISLNASTDEQRTDLMPLNRKYPLSELFEACRAFPLGPREHLTFEYVLLDGVNDTDSDARRVAALLAGIRSKVNLIPYNAGEGLPYRPSPLRRVLAFQKILQDRRIPAFIRISRGQDIMAACGQLRLAEMGDSTAQAQAAQPLSPA